MPPPPPPSASYLLVFDTDSEDEEEEEETYYPRPAPPRPVAPTRPQSMAESAFRIQEPVAAATAPTPIVATTTATTTATATSSGTRRPHVVEDDDDDDSGEFVKTGDNDNDNDNDNDGDDQAPKKLSKTQKKNRARRKKKKSKPSNNSTTGSNNDNDVVVDVAAAAATTEAATTTTKKKKKTTNHSVSFSTVSVRSYERCFSMDTVPLDGGWPLGSELYKFQDLDDATPLEDFEASKQEQLRERWEHIIVNNNNNHAKNKPIDETVYKKMTERPAGEPFLFETRQWDYLSGTKNPLFHPLSEDDRQQLFLMYSAEQQQQQQSNEFSSDSNMSLCSSNGPPSPPSKKGRNRSNSVSSCDLSIGSSSGGGGPSTPSKRRSRSSSMSGQFNETYNQVYVHHVRNELEQLRNERSKSGATGCNCRKLSVYLPPKDGSGGKKAQHRRMKPSKVANELKKRGIYNPKASRDELEKTLHDAVEKEPCCNGNDCFCARNGIDCQADGCSCWHDSHGHSKTSTNPSIQDIKDRCGNPMGTAVVDMTAIDNFRSKLLASGMCQPVGMAM